jgi:hypothetical protein
LLLRDRIAFFFVLRGMISLYHDTIIKFELLVVVVAASFAMFVAMTFTALTVTLSFVAFLHQAPDFGGAVLNHVQEGAEVLAERAALALQVLQREPAHVRLLKVAVLRVRRDGS